MIVHTSAIVLKSFPYSETSIIARCFTREMGKLSLIGRGARRKNSPLAACLQPLSYLDLVFYNKETRDLQPITKASFIEPWPRIQDDLKKITYCLSVVEITDKTSTDRDPHLGLFDELVSVLRIFNNRDTHLNLVFWYYEMKLLTHLGFKPDLDKRDFPGLVLPDPGAGPNSRKVLEMLHRVSADTIPDISLSGKDRKVISEYINSQLRYHFDGLSELKSLNVLKQIINP